MKTREKRPCLLSKESKQVVRLKDKIAKEHAARSKNICHVCFRNEATRVDGQCDSCYKALVVKLSGVSHRNYRNGCHDYKG